MHKTSRNQPLAEEVHFEVMDRQKEAQASIYPFPSKNGKHVVSKKSFKVRYAEII